MGFLILSFSFKGLSDLSDLVFDTSSLLQLSKIIRGPFFCRSKMVL